MPVFYLTFTFFTCQTNNVMESDTNEADLHEKIALEQPSEPSKKPNTKPYQKFFLPAGIILALVVLIPAMLLVFSSGKKQNDQKATPTPSPAKQIPISTKPTPASAQS